MDFATIFLLALAFVWVIFATVQDLRTREIFNWISFSLVIFALVFRFFYSLFSGAEFGFFYQGLIGLGIFLVLSHLLYYSKFFAGGDAKLMIALGPVLPLTSKFYLNIKIFIVFILVFLLAGAAYSLLASFYLSLRNFGKFKKEFRKQFKKNKKLLNVLVLIAIGIIVLGFFESEFLYMGLLVFALPYLYIYTKSVDETCMIRLIDSKKLTEGDWLYKDLKVGNRKIKADWAGLSMSDIRKIRKNHKKVLIRYGIPFSPVFLISLLVLVYLWNSGIVNLLQF